jgi:hypothetical protein
MDLDILFPRGLSGIGIESPGMGSRHGLNERIFLLGRDATPVGPIPADPRGLGPKPSRDGIKRTRPYRPLELGPIFQQKSAVAFPPMHDITQEALLNFYLEQKKHNDD